MNKLTSICSVSICTVLVMPTEHRLIHPCGTGSASKLAAIHGANGRNPVNRVDHEVSYRNYKSLAYAVYNRTENSEKKPSTVSFYYPSIEFTKAVPTLIALNFSSAVHR